MRRSVQGSYVLIIILYRYENRTRASAKGLPEFNE
jgi:hypothetical protein